MRTFNKQAASLKKSLKQNNLMPLFVVFSFIVMLSLTYKSVSKVNGVGNTMFKEGNRNRRRRVRQGFREGNEHDKEAEYFAPEDNDTTVAEDGDVGVASTGVASTGATPSPGPEGFLNGGGIGRKAGFVGREGMTLKEKTAHRKEHNNLNRNMQKVINKANKNQVGRMVNNKFKSK